jgi:hypothetical protein
MATNDMGPGPLKKARHLVKKITKKVTKGTFLEDSKKYPGEKNNPFAQKGGTTKKYQKGGGMLTPAGRIKSNKTRNIDLTGRQTTADVSRTKRNGDTVTKSVNTSRGFVPTASKTKTVTNKSGDVVSKETKSIGYNKAVRKTKRVANNVGRNANDTYAYKKGGVIKKPLRKAQDGIETPMAAKEEVLYSGPFTERQTKSLNKKYPSTVTPKGSDPWYNTKNYLTSGMNVGEDPVGAEKTEREDYEKFLRTSGRINFKKGGAKKTTAMKKMKTGGMVNANAKLKATATAGSRGVKAGVNPKAAASKVARGRSGGTSAAPKKATPGRK